MFSAPFSLLLSYHKKQRKRSRNPVLIRNCEHDPVRVTIHSFAGLQRNFPPSFRRFECFWLFDFKTGHEPVELLPGQLLYFQLISGPAESALDFHTFIQQHKSVRLPEQSFDPVTTFSTEEIPGHFALDPYGVDPLQQHTARQ